MVAKLQNVPGRHSPHGENSKVHPPSAFLVEFGGQSQVPVIGFSTAKGLQEVQAVGSLGLKQLSQVISQTPHIPLGNIIRPEGQVHVPAVVLKGPSHVVGNALVQTSLTWLGVNIAAGSVHAVQ